MTRLAGKALGKLGQIKNFLFKDMTPMDITGRLLPDVAIGGMIGAQTEGDIFDKIVSGGTSTVSGGISGLALGRLAGKNQALGNLLDFAGSWGGDYAGMMASDQVLRAKDRLMGGKGQTGYERAGEAQQLAMAQQLQQQIMDQMYGVDGLA
jgi:hypothetical protein